MLSYTEFINELLLHGQPDHTTAEALGLLKKIVGTKKEVSVEQYAHRGVFQQNTSEERQQIRQNTNHIPIFREYIAEREWTELEQLNPVQETLATKNVKAFIQQPNLAGADELPLIVTYNQQHWIFDGHHRLAAYRLRGIEKCLVEYLNLDEVL